MRKGDSMTKIIIDALGSDEGPEMVGEALKLALEERDFSAVFVGPKDIYAKYFSSENRVSLIEATEYIANTDSPARAIRRKKDASVVLGLEALNESGDVFLTAGSTGALLAGAYFITRRIEGIQRACLGATIPNPSGGTILVDTGANADTTPSMLYEFAILGSSFAEHTLHRKNPRVGLLNIGTEEGKGDKRTQEAYELLKESPLNFVGNVEARELLSGSCDVLVTDGFVGNVALKSLEGTAKTLFSRIKTGIYSSLRTKIGGMLLKPVFAGLSKDYNYQEHGGAPLLGTRKALFKAHGNSSTKTFRLAILEALEYGENFDEEEIIQQLKEIHDGKSSN